MTHLPDRVFTLKLWADPNLTDRGFEVWHEAVDQATLEDCVWEAVMAALKAALPRDPRDHDPVDWHTVKVEEIGYGATLCPDPLAHQPGHDLGAARDGRQEKT